MNIVLTYRCLTNFITGVLRYSDKNFRYVSHLQYWRTLTYVQNDSILNLKSMIPKSLFSENGPERNSSRNFSIVVPANCDHVCPRLFGHYNRKSNGEKCTEKGYLFLIFSITKSGWFVYPSNTINGDYCINYEKKNCWANEKIRFSAFVQCTRSTARFIKCCMRNYCTI